MQLSICLKLDDVTSINLLLRDALLQETMSLLYQLKFILKCFRSVTLGKVKQTCIEQQHVVQVMERYSSWNQVLWLPWNRWQNSGDRIEEDPPPEKFEQVSIGRDYLIHLGEYFQA